MNANYPAPLAPLVSLTPWFHSAHHKVDICDTDQTAQEVAACLVAEIAAVLQRKPHALLVPSVGRTMIGIFEVLRRQYRHSLDWQRVICVQMDEYAGISCSDPSSFAFILQRDLVTPLGIGCFVHFYDHDGAAIIPPKHYEQRVRDLGGIDCALHGVGRNSHIGFNEPRQSLRLTGGVVRLSNSTRRANDVPFHQGVTLGLGVLREAKSSIVVLLGEQKRDASYQLLFGSSGPHSPVTELRHCPQVSVYLDHAAVPGSFADHDYSAPRTRQADFAPG